MYGLIITPVFFVFSCMVKHDENSSFFGKNKAIEIPLTRRFHGILIGIPAEYNWD